MRSVASDLSLPSGGTLMRVASPNVTGPVGQPTTVEIARPAQPPLTMTILVEDR